jgi:hypothetical protein
MYIIRDIFYLKFGQYKAVKALIDEAVKNDLLAHGSSVRVLTDFTGKSYRLIFEEGYETIAEYEKSLTESMGKEEWQQWYGKVKPYVESSYREILKQIV